MDIEKHRNNREEERRLEYKVRYASVSKEGDRRYNEDSTLILTGNGQYVFALADGLGGQGNGKMASETVIQAVQHIFEQEDNRLQAQSFTEKAFQKAQKTICAKKVGNEYGDMMTTLVLLHIGDEICWGHIGDSRLYYFKENQLVSQTLDHSVPQILVYADEITYDEIRHHPDRNRLLRAMGKEWDRGDEFVLSEPINPQGGQAFLLCSDGFWEYIVEEQMQNLLEKASSVEEWLSKMEQEVQKNGAGYNMDNFSAVAVWITNE